MSRGGALAWAGLVLAAALAAGCGNDETDDENIAGGWSGTYTTSIFQSPEPTTLNLSQTGTTVTGTFSSGTGEHGSGPRFGTVAGTMKRKGFTFTWTQTDDRVPARSSGACVGSYSGHATVTDNVGGGMTMTGTFTGYDCSGNHRNGILSMTR